MTESALVIGGSGAVGSAVALALANDGFDVAVSWCRNRSGAERVVHAVNSTGHHGVAVRGCLNGTTEASERLAGVAQDAIGDIDVLVHSAALGRLRPMIESRRSGRSAGESVDGFMGVLGALPRVRAAVVLSSLWTDRVAPGYGALAVARSALEAAVRYLAVELGGRTRVNAVSAGALDVASVRQLAGDSAPDALRRIASNTPAGRLVTVDEVAAVVAFLVSDAASAVTGHTIVVDGGYSLVAAGLADTGSAVRGQGERDVG